MMIGMNGEFKKIVNKVRATQGQIQAMFKQRGWVDDARKFAEKQGKEVKKLLTSDMGKVKNFIEKERKELEKFQKQIPSEVKKLKKFVDGQKKELEKLLKTVRKSGVRVDLKKAAKKKPSTATKKKSSSSRSEAAAQA